MKNASISPEFLSLTYGAIIKQILKDNDFDCNIVNKEIFNLGLNIGNKMIDEFLSIKEIEYCKNFNDLSLNLGKRAFKYFLDIDTKVILISNKEFAILFNENPFEEYLDLNEELNLLCYSNIICGAIKGALEHINIKVNSYFIKDKNRINNNLKEEFIYEIRVLLESSKIN